MRLHSSISYTAYPVHPEQVASQLQGQHRERQTLTVKLKSMKNLESPLNLTCMPLDCERKLDYVKGTLAGEGRTCSSYIKNPDLSCCEVTVLIGKV